MICELHQRLQQAGVVGDGEFDLPLTQEQLADTLEMTPVHTNRVIQRMRKEGLISLGQRRLRIEHPQELEDIGEFDGSYLLT
ncbi:Crp/Fnr family transcriptional regulator [Sphingomonas alba]|uniref:Crp/Fnr family transcriptional regulator n=1 Tax=Sphingomonas alba TaxID=2908208 RepID=UPI003D6822CF